VPAGAVGHPLERLRADGAGLVHLGLLCGGRRRRRGRQGSRRRRSGVAREESTRTFEKRGAGREGGRRDPLERTRPKCWSWWAAQDW
jgi:hypothetical protein